MLGGTPSVLPPTSFLASVANSRTEKAGDPKVTGFFTDDAVLDSIARRNERGSLLGGCALVVPARGRPFSQPGDFASSESLGAQTLHLGRNLGFLSSRRGLPDFVCSLHQLPGVATLTELMFCSGSNDFS